MKRFAWTLILAAIIAVAPDSRLLYARGGHGGGGAGGGGTNGGHSGSSAPSGQAGSGHVGISSPAHVGGNSTVHVGGASNPINVGSGISVHSGSQPVINGSPQVGHHSGNTTFHHNSSFPHNVGIPHHPIGGLPTNVGTVNPQHIGHNNLLPGQTHLVGNHNHVVGNTVGFGNHHINLGGTHYQPAYYRHGGYYHGYWNGNRGWGYGGYGWGNGYRYGYGYRPYFWGLGGWGLGSLIYGSGYAGYYNPYYMSPVGAAYSYNYSQPIPVAYNTSVPVDPTVVNSTGQVMDSAVAAFKQNDYATALNIVNQGIQQYPDDSVLHEFRALVLFAQGNYQPAAATVHSVLAVGPGWDWTTLSGLYADTNLYATQLRTLEGFVKQNPMDGASRFLLAYHYMSDGYPDAAARQLQQVVALVPNDTVAASLLKMTSAPQSQQSGDQVAQPSPQPPIDPTAPAQTPIAAIDPNSIVGNWKASRNDGSNFALTLTGEKTFRWSYQASKQPEQAFDGTYSLDGNVIALERNGGGSLVAEISSNDGTKFNFKMVGSPEQDPGLNFVR